jgi:hypothetical protein
MEEPDWFGFLDRMTGFTGGGFRDVGGNTKHCKLMEV